MSLPVFEQLGATLGISFEGFLILKVRIDWHTTPVLDEVLQRDLLQLFLQLLDALGLLEAELHRQDLHGANVEEAPLHVKAHKQVEHLVADVKTGPVLSITEICCSSRSRLLAALLLTTSGSWLLICLLLLLAFLFELFPTKFAKFKQAIHLSLHLVHFDAALFVRVLEHCHKVPLAMLELAVLVNMLD